jgi:hypothetical protein
MDAITSDYQIDSGRHRSAVTGLCIRPVCRFHPIGLIVPTGVFGIVIIATCGAIDVYQVSI